MNIYLIIRERYDEFVNLCRQHQVKKLFAFGSSVTDHFDPEKSDIDVIAELDIEDPVEHGEILLTLWNNLELFFGRRVDLLTDELIQNPYLKKSLDATKKLIYDRQGEKVFV
jgi:predicted nucleotidyltransferase